MFFKSTNLYVYVFATLLITNLAFAETPIDSNLGYVPGELLVRFKQKPDGKQCSLSEKNQILSSFGGGSIKRNFKIVPGLTLVKLPAKLTVEDALQKFKNAEGILYIQPNYIYKNVTNSFPNDPCFSKLWGLYNTDDNDIDAPEAWNIITDSNIIVAVIDTGVDYNHPDLKANMWENPIEANGIPGIDDDNNGYIDDVYGYDFCTVDDGNTDPDPMDDRYHGTHVAGIIGAVGNNEEGVTGVCWNVKIMALKIISSNNQLILDDAIESIQYAVEMGAKVLNNSWGGISYNPALKNVIDAADEAGVLFIASAGNEGSDTDIRKHYPSGYDCENIISVMATDPFDRLAIVRWPDHVLNWASNYGLNTVDLGAPGVEILSTMPTEMTDTMNALHLLVDYDYGDGTSMAAAYVSGACALVWAKYPNLTHLQVKEAIMNSVDVPPVPLQCVSHGRLNLNKALKYWAPPPDESFSITDDIDDCVLPSQSGDSFINYTISYDANGFPDTNVFLMDYLPYDVDFNSADGNYEYDPETKTVTWIIAPFEANSSGMFNLRVKIKSTVPQGQIITNNAELIGDNYSYWATEETEICSIGTVYVNQAADAGGDGSSWPKAYKELRSAFTAIRNGAHPYAEQIFVAAGTYKPTSNPNLIFSSFEMIDGIDIYGHFAGWENNINQRNLADANYDSILTGDIDDDNTGEILRVVKAADSRIDGFTVTKCLPDAEIWCAGIYCEYCQPTIANCVIKNNNVIGIYCESGSDTTVYNTFLIDNAGDGIYCWEANSLNVSHCTFSNPRMDLNIEGTSAKVTDSLFYEGTDYPCWAIYAGRAPVLDIERCSINDKNCGIRYWISGGSIRNCIINNSGCGLSAEDSDVNAVSNTISNSIIGVSIESTNNSRIIDNIISNNQYDGVDVVSANSCSITGNIIYGNDIGIRSPGYYTEIRNNTITGNFFGIYSSSEPNIIIGNIIRGNYGDLTFGITKLSYNCFEGGEYYGSNIGSDPCFVDISAGNFHLRSDSLCIDAGDPCFVDANGTDIDGEDRIIDGDRNGTAQVDMGADEYYYSPADFNDDGFVNFLDFTVLANAWGTSVNQTGYNEQCDLSDDNSIDYKDLEVFCRDWLWIAGWLMDDYERGFGGEGAYFEDKGSEIETMKSMQGESMMKTAGVEMAAENMIKSEPVDIERMVKWLDEVWLSGDLKGSMTEDEYLEFRKAVEQSQ